MTGKGTCSPSLCPIPMIGPGGMGLEVMNSARPSQLRDLGL